MWNRDGSRRLLLAVDTEDYSRHDDRRQFDTQRRLIDVLTEAAAAAGLDRAAWECQEAGDGQLCVLPLTEREPLLVDDFVRELDVCLADLNHDLLPDARLRLRLAIHFGVVVPAANGYAGKGAVDVGRLADCAPARAALRQATTANLVLVLSERIFTETVAQRHTRLTSDQFHQVEVHNKTFRGPAWLYVPRFSGPLTVASDPAPQPPSDPTPPDPAPVPGPEPTPGPVSGSSSPDRPPTAPPAQVVTHVYGDVGRDAGTVVLGFQNNG